MSKPGNVRLPVLPSDWEWRLDVPKTRGDCPTVRPCPHINCPHHLWRVDGRDMPGRRYPGKLPSSDIRPASSESCVLDKAGRGPQSVAEIARVMGMTPRRTQQLLKALLALPYVAEWIRSIRQGVGQ